MTLLVSGNRKNAGELKPEQPELWHDCFICRDIVVYWLDRDLNLKTGYQVD